MTARPHPEPAPEPALLDFEGAARFLAVSPRLVRALVERRELASVKVGKLVRLRPEDLQAFIERHRREALR